MKTLIDLTGMRFNRLEVLRFVGTTGPKNLRLWECRCDCGKLLTAQTTRIKAGLIKSCGCLTRENSSKTHFKHGLTGTPEFSSWLSMMDRCCNTKSRDYARYGGKGITVCDRWRDPLNFVADMGPRPKGHTIDRIDNAKGYSPDNCRWATPLQQTLNRSITHFITYHGKTLAIAEWAKLMNISEVTISARLAYGWSDEAAIATPVRRKTPAGFTKRINPRQRRRVRTSTAIIRGTMF